MTKDKIALARIGVTLSLALLAYLAFATAGQTDSDIFSIVVLVIMLSGIAWTMRSYHVRN